MDQNLKEYLDTVEEENKELSMFYLTLIRNAAAKKAEARKRFSADDKDVDKVMKTIRKYDRIMHYLLDRWQRELKRREFGSA